MEGSIVFECLVPTETDNKRGGLMQVWHGTEPEPFAVGYRGESGVKSRCPDKNNYVPTFLPSISSFITLRAQGKFVLGRASRAKSLQKRVSYQDS